MFRTLFSTVKQVYTRERLELSDGDFMDIDMNIVEGSETIAILFHGLEGSSESKYMLAASKYLEQHGITTLSVNFRGCSGEDNRIYTSYHSGKTEDIEAVVSHVVQKFPEKNIVLIGYSMGGNMLLKYLGEQDKSIISQIKVAIAVSVPCDLESSSSALSLPRNRIYIKRFLRTLKKKAFEKLDKYPDAPLNREKIAACTNFTQFDDMYTAPSNGFKNAQDYWNKCSCLNSLDSIKIPTLLINAKDDTFLTPSCFPITQAEKHEYLHLEMPELGGHVGFNSKIGSQNGFWLEHRILQFAASQL